MTTPTDLELPDEDFTPPKLAFRWSELPRETCGPGGYSALNAFCDRSHVLSSGRTIWMDSIHQFQTYGGVLAGLPDGERNHEMHVEWALKSAASHFDVKPDEVLVLPPVILRSKVKTHRRGEELKEFDVEFLPPICTIARFSSAAIDEDEGMDSSLAIAWFQKTFGPPSEPAVIEELRKIDWVGRAVDRSW